MTDHARRVVVAEDDADDRMFMADAFEEAGIDVPLDFVNDGAELMEYLNANSKGPAAADHGHIVVLLDLNMPRMDGRAVLKEIRSDERFKVMPVVVFTTSNSEQDIQLCYEIGASSFITKPSDFSQLVKAVKAFDRFWLGAVSLPQIA